MAEYIDREAVLAIVDFPRFARKAIEELPTADVQPVRHGERTPADQERIMELACDLCKWPGEYKDPDDLWNERCDDCPLLRYLEEEEE